MTTPERKHDICKQIQQIIKEYPDIIVAINFDKPATLSGKWLVTQDAIFSEGQAVVKTIEKGTL